MNSVFFHIDVNSAFLSWTAAYQLQQGAKLDIRTISSVIGGSEETRHGIVLAKSIAAKKYGIKTGMSLMEARKLAGNDLLVIPPTYGLYARASKAFMDLLGNYSPNIYKFSIDEAFLDYTGMERLFGDPVKCAYRIKDEIKTKLGFTVNIGVSTNKLLAKMAGELKKPDMVHTIWPWEVKKKMWPLPIGELYMVGRRMNFHFKRKGILTIGDLAKTPIDQLHYYFKSNGVLLWQYANGEYIDEDKGGSASFQGMMTPAPKNKVKGVGNSGTMPVDITELEVAHQALMSLCETVGYRLRKGGYRGRVVYVGYRTNELKHIGKQRKFGLHTNTTSDLYIHVCQLFDELWDGEQHIRQLGIRVTDLIQTNEVQASFFESIQEKINKQQIDSVVDNVRQRYGNDALLRGKLYQAKMDPMIGGTFGLASHRPTDGLPI